MGNHKIIDWYLQATQRIIESLNLQSSPSRAMVGYEVIISLFFAAVIVMFLAHDLITIFFPPREAHSVEALIIGSVVMSVSLLAIYGRERLS